MNSSRSSAFQLRGHGYPQDDAMPNFFPDSKSSSYISAFNWDIIWTTDLMAPKPAG